jgi:hypothetical protein
MKHRGEGVDVREVISPKERHADPGVVDEDVDAAPGVECGLDHLECGVLAGNAVEISDRLAAVGAISAATVRAGGSDRRPSGPTPRSFTRPRPVRPTDGVRPTDPGCPGAGHDRNPPS